MTSSKKIFGERLAQRRRELGLSQRKLATLIGIRGPSIAAYETDDAWPSASTLIALAKALDVSTDYLLGLSDQIHYNMGMSHRSTTSPDEWIQEFSERLRSARRRQQLSQAALARQLGIDQSTMVQYESGRTRPSLAVARRLAATLDVSLDWLCGLA